jgi:hypothetical protein
MATKKEIKLKEALQVLEDLGMPRAQQNERSALCLLALLDLSPEKRWADALAPLIGITPIMDWVRRLYDKNYAPNTRETVRRQTMHQFVQAGVALYNPDLPTRPVNSPAAVYQIAPDCLAVLRAVGTKEYQAKLERFLSDKGTLSERYAKSREMAKVPLRVAVGREVLLSPGAHSELIRAICEEFGPRFVPGGQIVYVGDTGEKWGYFDEALFASLGMSIDNHGKMPDAVLFYPEKNWLILAEAVTSHGPVDAKRHEELSSLFKDCSAGLVFVSAFPDRRTFARYQENISWETEVWIADNPSHLIHFNGSRFLGPYPHTE